MTIARSVASSVASPVARSVVGYHAGGTDADAQAFLTAAGITDGTISSAVNNLVVAWKGSGQWERTIAIYPFVGGSASSHKYNLKNPADTDAANRITFSGTMTHNANGITTNGSTSVGNTHIDLNLQLPQYSATGIFYNRTATAPGSGDYVICGASNQLIYDWFSTNYIYLGVEGKRYSNDATFGPSVSGISDWTGVMGFAVNGPSSISFYRNTTRLMHDTTELWYWWKASGTIASRELWLFGNNNGGSIQYPMEARNIAFAAFTYACDQATWNELSGIVTTFQTALGRQV